MCQDSNCEKCIDGTHCQIAADGFSLPPHGAPIQCSLQRCIKCEYSPQIAVCLECLAGYSPKAHQCIRCQTENCSTCNPQNPSICLSCFPGMYLSQHGVCQLCNISTCLQCLNYSFCPRCSENQTIVQRYTYLGDQCLSCVDGRCIHCPQNPNICQKCQKGFGVFLAAKTCDVCRIALCKICSTNSRACEECIINAVLIQGDCHPCRIQKCLHCPNSVSTCAFCEENYGLSLDKKQCVACQVQNCFQCSTDFTSCDRCRIGFGLTDQNLCQQCPPFCDCSYNITHCDRCLQSNNPSRFLHSWQGKCPSKCYFSNCQQCQNYFICTECSQGMGVTPEGQCSPCSDIHCLNCSMDRDICSKCEEDMGVDPQGKCQQCEGEDCLVCSYDVSDCIFCKDGLGPQGGQCTNCLDVGCQLCNYLYTQCQKCSIGYALLNQSCVSCPFQCVTCEMEEIDGILGIVCGECIQSFFYLYQRVCYEVCGDGKAFYFQCDNQVAVDFDGCDNQCKVMENFTCNKTQENDTCCSYNQVINLTFVQIIESNLNEFILKVKVQPPLHIFATMSDEQINSSFQLQNQQLKILNAKYNEEKQQFYFSVKMLKQIKSNNFKLKFDPKEKIVTEFFATPSVIAEMQDDFSKIPFYSATVFSLTNILRILCFVIVIFVWISFLFGLFTSNNYGVEALFVVQFAWITFLWMDTPFKPTYSALIPLKYSLGYNFGYTKQKIDEDRNKILFTQHSEMSDSVFINNFGFCFILLSLSFLLVLIFGIIYKLSKPNISMLLTNMKEKLHGQKKRTKNDNQIQKKLQQQKKKKQIILENLVTQRQQNDLVANKRMKKQKYYEFCLQIMFQCAMCSLIPFFNAFFIDLVVFNSKKFVNTQNILIFLISLMMILFTIFKFYFQAFHFLAFRCIYRLAFLFQNHYLFHILVIISATVLLCVFQKQSFLPFIPLGLMIIYTLIFHPHLQTKNNIRSVVNYTTMCILIGLKIYLSTLWEQTQSPQKILLILFIYLGVSLIPILVSVIFQIIQLKQILQNEQGGQNLNNVQLQILTNLSKCNPLSTPSLSPSSYFKSLIPRNQSILSYSQQLHNVMMDSKDMVGGKGDNGVFDFDRLHWKEIGAHFEIQTDEALPRHQDKSTMPENNRNQEEFQIKNDNLRIKTTKQVFFNENYYIQYKASKAKLQKQQNIKIDGVFVEQYEKISDGEVLDQNQANKVFSKSQ